MGNNLLIKIIICSIFALISYSCQNQSYSLTVEYPLEGKIFINDLPIKNWLTEEPVIMDEKTNLYFLDLSHQTYNLRIELNDSSVIDTFFVLRSGESYYNINLRTGELWGFEFN